MGKYLYSITIVCLFFNQSFSMQKSLSSPDITDSICPISRANSMPDFLLSNSEEEKFRILGLINIVFGKAVISFLSNDAVIIRAITNIRRFVNMAELKGYNDVALDGASKIKQLAILSNRQIEM